MAVLDELFPELGTGDRTSNDTLLEDMAQNHIGSVLTIDQSFSAERNLEQLVEKVTAAGVLATGAEMGAFFYNIFDSDNQNLKLHTIVGADPELFSKFPVPRNTKLLSPNSAPNQVIRCDSVSEDPRFSGMPPGHLPVVSYLSVPVFTPSGHNAGILIFGHSSPAVFDERSEQIAKAIAAQAAVSIDNALLFRGAQIEIAKRESVEADLAEANATLEAKVAERTKELEESQRQVLEEISARQATQDALRQAQKMESVGQLTGGIAHDFNNMLTVIIGNLELTKMTLARNPDSSINGRMERQVTMAIEAAIKAEKLTAQLLAFSRKSRLHPERLDVNEVVKGVYDMVQRALGINITCELDLQAEPWLCLSDKNQLESAILNLSINGRDAMSDGGHLIIKTRNRDLDDTRFVSVSVTDTGSGMNKDTIARAFEPFFTTKDVGKGSGLGLSMVYGFCQQSNGKVFIDSVLGKGTTIEMLFPYTAGETTRQTNQEEDFHYDKNKASILIVDDEPGVRELAAAALSDMGYNVMSAEDGSRALEVISNPEIEIDLLFTDVVMPNGIDGFQLARRALEIRPNMPVVFTTGHAEVALKELKKDLSRKIKVLGKPYRLNDLSSMIASELSANRI